MVLIGDHLLANASTSRTLFALTIFVTDPVAKTSTFRVMRDFCVGSKSAEIGKLLTYNHTKEFIDVA